MQTEKISIPNDYHWVYVFTVCTIMIMLVYTKFKHRYCILNRSTSQWHGCAPTRELYWAKESSVYFTPMGLGLGRRYFYEQNEASSIYRDELLTQHHQSSQVYQIGIAANWECENNNNSNNYLLVIIISSKFLLQIPVVTCIIVDTCAPILSAVICSSTHSNYLRYLSHYLHCHAILNISLSDKRSAKFSLFLTLFVNRKLPTALSFSHSHFENKKMETKIDIPQADTSTTTTMSTSMASEMADNGKILAEEAENQFDMQVGCPWLFGFAIGTATWVFAMFLFFIEHRGRKSKAFRTGLGCGIVTSTVVVILFLVFAIGVKHYQQKLWEVSKIVRCVSQMGKRALWRRWGRVCVMCRSHLRKDLTSSEWPMKEASAAKLKGTLARRRRDDCVTVTSHCDEYDLGRLYGVEFMKCSEKNRGPWEISVLDIEMTWDMMHT